MDIIEGFLLIMETEIWKDVVGYEGLYKVSNLGNIFSIRKDKVMHPSINVHGYYRVHLKCKNKTTKTKSVHLLVAYSFLNHSACGMEFVINHKDHNKLNNNVDNLEVVTQRYNSQHTFLNKNKSSRYIGVYKYKHKNGKISWTAQIQINKKCKKLGYFKTEYDAHLAYQKENQLIKGSLIDI